MKHRFKNGEYVKLILSPNSERRDEIVKIVKIENSLWMMVNDGTFDCFVKTNDIEKASKNEIMMHLFSM